MAKIQATKNEIEEVQKILAKNIEAVQERGELMSDLQNKTGEWGVGKADLEEEEEEAIG